MVVGFNGISYFGEACRQFASNVPSSVRLRQRLIALGAIMTALGGSGIAVAARADEATRALVIADERVIHSKILGQDRKIFIYHPGLVFGSREPGPYPVLYLLDGERQLPLVAGQIDFLSKTNLSMPQMIVVGIDTNHYDRLHDLTPTHSDRADPDSPIDTSPTSPTRTSGGGEAFLRFIDEELAPYIDSHYPAAPYKVLAGHSLGGLLAVHALLWRPEMFDAYVAVSPSLWWDDETLLRGASDRLGPGRLADKQLFVSISGEGGKFHEGLNRFDHLLSAHASSGLVFRYLEYPGESHASGPAAAYYDSWKFLFPAWLSPASDDTPQKTEFFYADLSKRYGYRVLPPEGIINGRAYSALRGNRTADALGFFRMNVANYPGSANALDSMGDGYAKMGQAARAAACYAQALSRDPGNTETQRKLADMRKDNNALGTASDCASGER